MAPINRGVCGMDHPFRVEALAQGTVALKSRVVLGCPVISMVDTWIASVVQPAAELYYGTSVVEVKAGGYACRTMNNQPGARMSEHSFGNAMDIMSFRLADGREISVVKGWKGPRDEQEFLREVFVGACRYFGTVLGPGADIYHYDHFHIDLARHTPNGSRRICKPAIKFEPRIDPDRPATPVRVPPRLPPVQKPLAPSDDIENDPFVSNDEMADAAGTRRAPASAGPGPAVAGASPALASPAPAPVPSLSPTRAPPTPPPAPVYAGRPPVQASVQPVYPTARVPVPAGEPAAPIPPGWIVGAPGRPVAPVPRPYPGGQARAAAPLDLSGGPGFTGSGLY